MRLFAFLLFLGMTFAACDNDPAAQKHTDHQDTAHHEHDGHDHDGHDHDHTVKISPLGATQSYPDAKITNMSYQDKTFSYGIENYELKAQTPDADQLMCANSGQGQHIHLIIDNAPYLAKYEATFTEELPDGKHHILSFLSRSYHESIKTDAAHKAVIMDIADGKVASETPITEPMLFYSRPKGTYVGKDTKKLLLDFYPVNATLGADYKVKVAANGHEIAVLDRWEPYALEGLPMGENKITLTLIDGTGATVKAPYNPVTRSFTLKPDPAEGM